MSERKAPSNVKYPGILTTDDGSGAVIGAETAASEAAGAYPITPSTQMGEGWAAAVAAGETNVNGRSLIFFEPEGEHAAAGVMAGLSMTGLRSANFSSGQGIAYMHESLYAAVGKRLTYVLNVAARAMTKHALNVHAGHDDYHAIDDTGFFQVFAKSVQEVADLNLIAHRIAELSLNPGVCAQDGFLTSHTIESFRRPERELIREFLGDPSDMIESPTPAQQMIFGDTRRRIPELFDYDYPAMLGVVQNQDSYAQGVAAQRPFYFDHIQSIADRAFEEYAALTGRQYARASGYRLADADLVIVGQGSLVANAEAVVDHLRETKGTKVGALNLTMFRPFPSDLVTTLLRGKKAVTVLERTDQPLASDLPMLREIRTAMAKGMENHRARKNPPHEGLAACAPKEIPEFYSGSYGMGSRDLQPADLIAAVENMQDKDGGRRHFYLGIDFIRRGTELPKLEIWQERIKAAYPGVAELSLERGEDVNLIPSGGVNLRIHSVGGWGAITMGKNLATTASELLGLCIKANPKYGSEKKGQPTTFYASFASEPIRTNCELKHVNAVLAPDGNVFHHDDALEGMDEGGILIIQSDQSNEHVWNEVPERARRVIREKNISIYALDGFAIAHGEASNPELRFRMQGTAFMGAFFRTSPLVEAAGLDEEHLFSGIRQQLQKKFGQLGEQVVEDNFRVIERGYREVHQIDTSMEATSRDEAEPPPVMPEILDGRGWRDGIANPGRFWEQVGSLYKAGEEPIADPFTALSAMPAATSAMRDMTMVRFSVPEFIAENCTGCGKCWTQCPDTAIPGVVNTTTELIEAAIEHTKTPDLPMKRLGQIVKHIDKEAHKILTGVPFNGIGEVLSLAFQNVIRKLDPTPERRAELDAEWGPVYSALAEFPLAKTAPFFDLPERKKKGSGGLLSVTINPDTCKGCDICVAVCPDDALRTVQQTDEIVDHLRDNWALWKKLPETDDRYVNISDLEEGIGVLSSLLLKQRNYQSTVGGDGACMGCGEKTDIHLVLSAVNALLIPRVEAHVRELDQLITDLEAKARSLVAADADLDAIAKSGESGVDVHVDGEHGSEVGRLLALTGRLKDLRWHYTEGPSGKGRSRAGFANSTGCSSVWGSTYPFNPYPFPWANHLFQDAPSLAIGIFEGHMRKMADGFRDVRRARLELAGEYDAEEHEPFFSKFDWEQFSDEEFALCPPLFAVGGDGAMMDIGFQNLSRLLASNKPIRVVVVDTQVYSNTGGQACTSGFIGQVSDMAAFGPDQHGKEEKRKELALLAIAHRGAFVLQTSQGAPSHLLGGVLKGLGARRPSIFILNTPCPVEWGIGDSEAPDAARLALESRAVPHLVYDPEGGPDLADCVDLEGNPELENDWPTYELRYREAGEERAMTLPVTTADWAAHEARFRKHFTPMPDDTSDSEWIPFHEYVALTAEEREDKSPFIYFTPAAGEELGRLAVAEEIVTLAEERLGFWHELREMAGIVLSTKAREKTAEDAEAEFESRSQALRAEYEAKLTTLQTQYPQLIARRMAEGLLRSGGDMTIAQILEQADTLPARAPAAPPAATPVAAPVEPPAATREPPPPESTAVAAPVEAAPEPAQEVEEDDDLAMEAYIDTEMCTSCDDCLKLNKQMFAYNDDKQAYIKDLSAGTFKQLVMAAEACPAEIIHPGTPLDPNEKDLDKLIKRAERFN
ncbi:MAG: 2-oxoacid:acceptor oxidoreductase family protein [Myxococcota bacterium]|jgi:pyruvate-ferredoxin/flavodoxin oxidoreductase|nr:2-oxoacid:acceptor oxidoreductase family protein [Myxococcota bacterium]